MHAQHKIRIKLKLIIVTEVNPDGKDGVAIRRTKVKPVDLGSIFIIFVAE